MKKTILFLFLILFLALPSSAQAEDPPIFERLSQDTLKVRGYGYHGFNFQDSSFVGNFPPTCFDSSLGDVYWYVTYTLSDNTNPSGDLQLETPHTTGHYPTSFDYTVTFPGTYHLLTNQRLIQHCSNGTEFIAYMNNGYDMKLTVGIARDLGVLNVDRGNTLDIYAFSNRAAPETFRWDLDNDGIFETNGPEIVFSAVNLTSGQYPITVKVHDQWGEATDSFHVNVLDYPVVLNNLTGQVIPNEVTESSGFLTPENSLSENNTGAIQDGNPDFFYIQYALPSPIFTHYQFSKGEVVVRLKNSGVDPARMSIQFFGDRTGRQVDPCTPEITPTNSYQEYTCSYNLYDYQDKMQKVSGIYISFSSYDGRNENIDIDSVSFKYKIKESYLDLPLDAGGSYTVVQGNDLVVNANATLPSNGDLYVSWDFNNDGYYDQGGVGTSYTHYSYNFADLGPGTHPLGVKLTSRGGGSRIATSSFTIVPAAVDAGGPYSVDQGQAIQVSATSNDPNSTNYVWDLNNDGEFESAGQEVTFSATDTPGEYPIHVRVTRPNGSVLTDNAVVTVNAIQNPTRQLTSLDAARIWVGLADGADHGIKFDLKTEVYRNDVLISSGQVDSVAGGNIHFDGARHHVIPFGTFSPVDFPAGSNLRLKVYVRNACSGSGKNNGTARLWFDNNAANSRFKATIDSNESPYFLRDGFVLATTAGTGPKNSVDQPAGQKCSNFKSFGTWKITP